MPDNIVSFDKAKRKQKSAGEKALYGKLSRIDELEDALELMEELNLETRAELSTMIEQLEREASELDPPTED